MARLRNWMAEARRLEATGDLQAAIAIYRKALVAQEETTGFGDLSVQNGLGDLFLRVGRVDDALEAYEGAAQQCEDQQLYANAIALCKKILRNAPGYAPAYRRAARLSALSGLEAEARIHYARYRDLVAEEGRPSKALEALREIVEVTGDEELTFELVDALIAQGRKAEALETLRSVRDRRDSEGRGVVQLVRQIQELQLELEPDQPPLESEPAAPAVASIDEPDVASTVEPEPAEPEPAEPEAAEPEAAYPEEADPETSIEADLAHWSEEAPPAETDPDASPSAAEVAETSSGGVDLQSLAARLRAVLREREGEDRLRNALAIIERMLHLAPGRFDLLIRKLQFAHELGDERATVRAYLALGECLDRSLGSFTVRLLSTSTDAGAVTAAIGVEDRTGSVRGS